MRRRLLVALAAIFAAAPLLAQSPAPDAAATVGAPRGKPLSGAELEARADEISSLLRCPVCQGLSVADSPSPMAQKMRAHVRELVAAGYDRDQILTYFEGSYGEFVRLRPALRGVNWVVWFAPLGGLLAGGALVTWALRRGRKAAPPEAEPEGDLPARGALPEDADLAGYVLKVREQVYGWAGGRPPEEA